MAEQIDVATKIACDIASGRKEDRSMVSDAQRVKAAIRDVDRKGNGSEIYRRVLRGGWTWLTAERLPFPIDRQNREFWLGGKVFPGEMIARFRRPISGNRSTDKATLVCFELVQTHDVPACRLITCVHVQRRDGQYAVALPDGSSVIVPDPDWK